MGQPIVYKYGTEAQILALTPSDPNWADLGFYYPSDKPYFYQAVGGAMKQYGGGDPSVSGVGITLNDKIIGGVKSLIESEEVLKIPEHWEYNITRLLVAGTITNEGTIKIL